MTGDGGTKEAIQTRVCIYDKKFLLPAESADYFTNKKTSFCMTGLDCRCAAVVIFFISHSINHKLQ